MSASSLKKYFHNMNTKRPDYTPHANKKDPNQRDLLRINYIVSTMAEDIKKTLPNDISKLGVRHTLRILRERDTLESKIRAGIVMARILKQSARIEEAITQEETMRAKKLRYDVYALDRQWEEENPSLQEEDEFDRIEGAVRHNLLTFNGDSEPTMCVRVVCPVGNDPNNLFPMQHAVHDLEERFENSGTFLMQHGEVSRLCRKGNFKQRVFPGATNEENDFIINFMNAGTPALFIRMAAELATKEGKIHCAYALKSSLLRIIKRTGDKPILLGDPVDYHGKRYVFFSNIQTTFRRIAYHMPDIWALATDEGRLTFEASKVASPHHFPQQVTTPQFGDSEERLFWGRNLQI